MPSLLRRRLVCFYCNSRSKQVRVAGLQSFRCDRCEAVNHLDENGDITDPPIPVDSTAVRYAQSIPRQTSPLYSSDTTDSFFCRRCLQNQRILTETLASYQPIGELDQDGPKQEERYRAYKHELEERYPQVCEECEPKVRARIRQAGYVAKADHLRRMMDKTRSSFSVDGRWSWKYFAVCLATVAWWISLASQILWNAMGALSAQDLGLSENGAPTTILGCLLEATNDRSVHATCASITRATALRGLALAVLTAWWNPCLRTKIARAGGRLTGLGEYYKLQTFLLLLRAAAMSYLWNEESSHADVATQKAIHSTLLGMTVVTLPVLLTIVKIDRSPLVSFQDSPEPLLKQRTIQPKPSKSGRPSSQPDYLRPQFPVQYLAAPSQYTRPAPQQTLTPPPDEESAGDTMDWTPSQPSQPEWFRPSQPSNLLKPTPLRPQNTIDSPFKGRLPQAPMSQERQLRNPLKGRPLFPAAASTQQKSLFNRMNSKASSDSEGSETSHAALDENLSPAPNRMFGMANPRFFPKTDGPEETGLESLFTGAFSLHGEGERAQASQARAQTQTRGGVETYGRSSRTPAVNMSGLHLWSRTANVLCVFLASISWSLATAYPSYETPLRLAALMLVILVAGRSLLESFQPEEGRYKISEMFIFATEVLVGLILSNAIRTSPSAPTEAWSLEGEEEDQLGGTSSATYVAGWFIACVFLQEVFTFAQVMRELSGALSTTRVATLTIDNDEERNVHPDTPARGNEHPSPIESRRRPEQRTRSRASRSSKSETDSRATNRGWGDDDDHELSSFSSSFGLGRGDDEMRSTSGSSSLAASGATPGSAVTRRSSRLQNGSLSQYASSPAWGSRSGF